MTFQECTNEQKERLAFPVKQAIKDSITLLEDGKKQAIEQSEIDNLSEVETFKMMDKSVELVQESISVLINTAESEVKRIGNEIGINAISLDKMIDSISFGIMLSLKRYAMQEMLKLMLDDDDENNSNKICMN